MKRSRETKFVICVYNEGQEASLLLRKIYEQLPDPDSEKEAQIRVIDETGEDYLHPAKYFVPIRLPKDVEEIIGEVAELELRHR
ncbi:MAG TPA: hypothetical protein VMI06_14725 [Terriglobia bacterium]|nr:hypothetical protein [Terriglobia bacterium]